MAGDLETVAFKDLRAGDIIWSKILIDKADLKNPNATSGTAKAIRAGKPVKRLCVVLKTGVTSVEVTYVTTFDHDTSLPTSFTDKSLWYPIKPATKEDKLDPLPSIGKGDAQWASLRRTQTVAEDPMERAKNAIFTQDSVDKISKAMKA